ncbi:hypothetical protein [Chroococcidiopsis sp.]|uniref:hypothetical protein n=1 Tax=Chroococcidiopsis sp. TaxID=3088168 RepID=UPI003F3090DC
MEAIAYGRRVRHRCALLQTVESDVQYVYLLADNLLCGLMWSAGTTYETSPLSLSLQGTRHHFNNFMTQLLTTSSTKVEQIYRTLLKVIVHKAVPERPLSQ